jgi:3-oxoadipate enol-lactonase
LYIERDEAKLFFTEMGSGPDLVMVHPTPVHHAFWMPVAEQLADRYRIWLVDLRGHGQSGLGTGPVTLEKLARDVRTMLEVAGVRRAAFAGCSIGGYLLYEYWRKYPQQMLALAFVCSKPQPDDAAMRERRHQTMRDARKPGGLAQFFDATADTLLGPTCLQREPKKRAAVRGMMDAMQLEAMLAVQQGLMLRPDSVPTLATIDVPVCAIAGEEDRSSTPEEMRVIAEQAPRAELHVLPGTGHYAPFEQPQKIAEILGSFLDAHLDARLEDAGYDPETAG